MNPIGGSKLYIGLRVAGKSEVTEVDFIGQDWLEIGGLVTLGSLGDSQEVVSQAVLSGRLAQTKGTVSGQVMENTFLPIAGDPGQQRFLAAMESCSPYAFKVEWNEGCEDDPMVDLFYGLAMPGSRAGGDANTAQLRSWAIAVDSNVVEAPFIWDSMPYLLFLGDVKGTALDYSVADSRFQDVFAATPALALDDPVARWNDQGPNGMFAFVTVSSERPLVKTNGLLFNGSNNSLSAFKRDALAASNAVTMPDLSDSAPGKGFTCTGLTLDTSTNTLWAANYGRATPSGGTFRPSIVNITKDGAFISEVDMTSTIPSMTQIQGIAYDASDDTFWLCSIVENLVRHVGRDGTSIGSFSSTGPSGIAIDPTNNQIIVCDEHGVFTVYSKAGVLSFTSLSIRSSTDQLFYDSVNEILYYTSDVDPDHIGVIHYPTWQPIMRFEVTPSVGAIEGLVLDGSKMYVCNDAYYHSVQPGLNKMITFDVPAVPAFNEDPKITMFGRVKLNGTPSATRAIASIGGASSYAGVGLFSISSSTTSLRLFVNSSRGTAKRDQIDFTGLPDLTTIRAFVVEVDFNTEIARLWIDGVQFGGDQSLVNASGGVATGWFGVARQYTGASPLAISVEKAGFAATIYNQTMRAKLDDWLST